MDYHGESRLLCIRKSAWVSASSFDVAHPNVWLLSQGYSLSCPDWTRTTRPGNRGQRRRLLITGSHTPDAVTNFLRTFDGRSCFVRDASSCDVHGSFLDIVSVLAT